MSRAAPRTSRRRWRTASSSTASAPTAATASTAQSGANAKRNVVYSNKGHGIVVEGYAGDFRVIANNLVYNNGDAADEYNIMLGANYWQGKQALIENNTVYGGNGIYIGHPIAVTNRNNLIWATGAGRYAIQRYTFAEHIASDYMESDDNDIIATGGATFGWWQGNQSDLLEWRQATGYDTHSFSVDPLFVNAAGADGVIGGTNGLDDNFHLASTIGSFKGLPFTALTTAGFTADASQSPCIDAALPASSVGAELAPNGGARTWARLAPRPTPRSPVARGPWNWASSLAAPFCVGRCRSIGGRTARGSPTTR